MTLHGTNAKLNFREVNGIGSIGYTNGATRLISDASVRVFLNADNAGTGSNDLVISSNCDHDSPGCNKLFWLTQTGKLGLGCDPNASELQNYLLSVNGNVRARKIKVDNSTLWGDYVFDSNFEIPSLESIENFVREKGHLPGFKSAEQYRAEGLDLEEIIAEQQVTIEILYLHLNSLKKRMDLIENQ